MNTIPPRTKRPIFSFTKKLLAEIDRANRRHRLFKRGDSIVVGVSGGPDSAALLWLLDKLARRHALRLHAAHLNHRLDIQHAPAYERSAKRLAISLGVPFHSTQVDIQKRSAREKRSLEESGRIARYAFFEKVAAKTRSSKIATAHTLDDQAETVLMRLLRGSGLKGLSAIPAKRAHGRFEVIRPLLSCRKKELLDLLRAEKIPFIIDRSNRDPLFFRNRVRNRLLPELERAYNPGIRRSLASLQAVCANAQHFLERRAAAWLKRRLKLTPRGVKIPVRLSAQHPALQTEIALEALAATKGDSKRLTQAHALALLDLVSSKKTASKARFPGVFAQRKGDWLHLSRLR